MSTWNIAKATETPDIINMEGVAAYSVPAEFEVAEILLASFGAKDSFYEKGDDKMARLTALLPKLSLEFCAQLALFARHECYMRALPQFVAAHVLTRRPNPGWKRNFFRRFPGRADDVMEVLAAAESKMDVRSTKGRSKAIKVPHFLMDGFGAYLSSLDEYQLAKYSTNVGHKEKKSMWALVDAVNLCRPKHTPALEKLVKGTLPKADTHESAVHAAVVNTLREADPENKMDERTREVLKLTASRTEWERLLNENRLGYMALLKNIRNVLLTGVSKDARESMFAQLVDKRRVRNSKVLPFRFLSAYKAVGSLPGNVAGASDALRTLSIAVGLSLDNVPELGNALTIVDESGSMMHNYINQDKRNRQEAWQLISSGEMAMLFAAALAVKGSDTVLFHETARYVRINPANSLFSAVDLLGRESKGTRLGAVLDILEDRYDNIIILSDHQSWIDEFPYLTRCTQPDVALQNYKKRTGADPDVFCWSLVPYGSQILSPSKVHLISGWSDRAFEQIKWCKEGKDGLIRHIKEIDLYGKYPQAPRQDLDEP